MKDQFELFTTLKPSQTIATANTPHVVEAHKLPQVYHNTTELKGEELSRAQVRASGETEKILRFFQEHPHAWFTPWDVYFHFGQQLDRNNVRRCITNLTTAGYLVKGTKAGQRKSGPFNQPNYTWKLKAIDNT